MLLALPMNSTQTLLKDTFACIALQTSFSILRLCKGFRWSVPPQQEKVACCAEDYLVGRTGILKIKSADVLSDKPLRGWGKNKPWSWGISGHDWQVSTTVSTVVPASTMGRVAIDNTALRPARRTRQG